MGKIKIMKKLNNIFAMMALLIAISLIGNPIESFGQTKYTGYQYVVNQDDYYSFKYTREYKEEGNVYTTIYKIYHPAKGHHVITITATHDKSQKEVKVDIENAGGGIFAHINDENSSYDIASLEPFGFRGAAGALGGSRVPNQLLVKFVSKNFENVKVIHVNGTEPGTSNFVYYVLDEKN